MMQLHHDHEKFQEKDTIIVVIGPENRKSFQKYWQENGFEFFGLPDEKHHVLKLYGQKVNVFKIGRMPAQMIVDKTGILRYVHYGHSMKDIPEKEEVFAIISSL